MFSPAKLVAVLLAMVLGSFFLAPGAEASHGHAIQVKSYFHPDGTDGGGYVKAFKAHGTGSWDVWAGSTAYDFDSYRVPNNVQYRWHRWGESSNFWTTCSYSDRIIPIYDNVAFEERRNCLPK